MNADLIEIKIVHNKADNHFEVILGEKKAVLIYMIKNELFIILHTEVPPGYEGRGIAGKLNHAALDYAVSEGYKVRSYCSFTTLYIERHPEYATLLA